MDRFNEYRDLSIADAMLLSMKRWALLLSQPSRNPWRNFRGNDAFRDAVAFADCVHRSSRINALCTGGAAAIYSGYGQELWPGKLVAV